MNSNVIADFLSKMYAARELAILSQIFSSGVDSLVYEWFLAASMPQWKEEHISAFKSTLDVIKFCGCIVLDDIVPSGVFFNRETFQYYFERWKIIVHNVRVASGSMVLGYFT